MSIIMIRCPHTGHEVSTGIDMDWIAFNRLRNVRSETNCPACGGAHSWTRNEAWLSHGARDQNWSNPIAPQRWPPRVVGTVQLKAV